MNLLLLFSRLLSVLYMGICALFSVVALCFIGPGITAAVGALFFAWLAVWRWEVRSQADFDGGDES